MSAKFLRIGLCTTLLAGLTGCDLFGPERGGQATITMTRSASPHASFENLSLALEDEGGTVAAVSLASVERIDVKVVRVDALRADGDEEQNRSWRSLEVISGGELNLLLLPAEEAEGIVLARGELDAGQYRKVRLFVEDASITFSTDVTIGGSPNARTYVAGEAHSLRIPSAEQSGVKTNASFTILEGGETEVALVFDGVTSVQNLVANPNFLIMAPVLKVRSP